ncbi:MAG: hypothetical protein R8G66_21890 [Cytophagales bacterium]|nr:hypothetical protein [Cytophagales bacterium]
MKRNKIIFFFATLLFLNACSNTENPEVVEELTFTNLTLADRENTGTAADINLTVFMDGTFEVIDEVRLFLINTQESANIDAALISGFSQSLLAGRSLDILLDADLKDTQGEVVEEGVPYQVVLQGIFSSGNTITSELSNTLTLANEIVVTTPKLQGDFNGMEDIAVGPEGELYIAGGGTAPEFVYKVTSEVNSTVFTRGHFQPVGIDVDSEGNVYVSNFNANSIQKITPTAAVTTFATSDALSGGGGIAINNEGVLFNAFFAGSTIFQITEGTVDSYVTDGSLQGLVGMTYDPEEDKLYASNFNDGTIFHVSSDGTRTLIADTPLSIGHLAYKNGLFYATGWHQHQVMEISKDGEITATIGTGVNGDRDGTEDATFNSPNGIAVSLDGKYVYVTQGNGKLRKIILPRAD